LLRTALESRELDGFSNLEREGLVQRFEYTFELAWKTLKDYLEYSGVVLEQVTPRFVIKAAFAARIIADGDAWIAMLAHRNLMTHTYDEAKFREAVEQIARRYVHALDQVHGVLEKAAP
jgi:nucleotidyltransferase substrate binding protein (TIGR01987 family)